jgi:fermentation-respiration switch protein FrsA (DUF1100 family)
MVRIGPVAVATLVASFAPRSAPGPVLASLARDLAARPVELRSGRSTLRGELVRGRRGAGAVILLHGVGASRLDMAGRARFLAEAGYSVLLVDFRGHGESSAARSTWGALESGDVRAAVAFLRAAAPSERIGVIGISMGGAAALLGPAPLPVEALVLESVYPTVADAVRGRLRAWLGPIGEALAPRVVGWLLPREGVTAEDLRPIDRMHEQTAPVFVLAGTADRYTTVREARELFARAREPKALWEVVGAAHVDLHAFARAEYERRVGAFLARHLRGPLPSPAARGGGGPGTSGAHGS